jgi:hypothetical protein
MSNIVNVRDAINRTTDLAGLRSVLQQAVRYYRGINLANERGRALLIRMIACFEISLLTVDLYINLAQRQRQRQRGTGRKSHKRKRSSKH